MPQAKTAKLVERFGNLSSLSGLNLSVDVERPVIVFAAQVASEVTGQSTLPTSQLPQASATTSQTATPGGAPSAAAAIPQPSTGTTAPTPLSTAASVVVATDGAHFSASAQETQKPMSLVQQVLDALKDTKVESHKVQKYLPDFFEKLREDLGKELRGQREHDQPATQVQTPATAPASLYVSVSESDIDLALHSYHS